MKKIFLILLILNSIAITAFSGEVWVEKIKNYNMTFDANGISQLDITNKYGNVVVTHWEKRQIKVSVTIKANGTNDVITEKYLNSIDIKNYNKNGILSLITSINSSPTELSLNKKTSYLMVNYEVTMPKNIKLNVDNKFGDIVLPAFYAPLGVNLQHGVLKAPIISNQHSQVNIKFSSAQIKELVGASLNSVNSNVNLTKALNADIKTERGVFVVEVMENIKAQLNYTKASLNELGKDIELDLYFINDLKLGNLNDDLKHLIINTNYSDIQVPVIPAYNASFNVQTTNGQFFIGQGVDAKVKKDLKASTPKTKVFDAIIGEDDTPKRVILIKATNGDVKIKK